MTIGGRRSRIVPVLGLAALAGLLLWGGWTAWASHRDRAELAEAQAEIQAGRHGTAARKLTVLLARRPDSDEAAYLLGNCERARGRVEAASAAWARVTPGSRFSVPSILRNAEMLLERGRLAEVEALILSALRDPRVDPVGLRWFLAPFYRLEGRFDEAARLLEANYNHVDRSADGALDEIMSVLRLSIPWGLEAPSVEEVRSFLDQAGRSAPDDDRVWLGQANLAIRLGAWDEASRRLDACLRRRPEDVPVWCAYLDWAVGSGRVAEARKALAHLPAHEASPAQVHRLSAWFASRRGDSDAERTVLDRLIAADPSDVAALDRLAELAAKDGRNDRRDEIGRMKAELSQSRERYQFLFRRNQPMRDAVEMASLAERLGHWFEARVFLSLAEMADPGRPNAWDDLARIDSKSLPIASPGGTLADVLAP